MEVEELWHCMQAGSEAHLPNVETEPNSTYLYIRMTTYVCLPFLYHSKQASKAMQDNEKHQIHFLEANLQSNHRHVQG